MNVLLAIGFAIAVALGIWWGLWSLWCWVLPQVWATGPEAFIRPGYWLFVGAWLLLGFIGSMFHSGSK